MEYQSKKARNQLACIDYQKHKDREAAVDKNGVPKYQRLYSKRNNTWSAVAVKKTKQYSYVPELLRRMVEKCLQTRERLSDPVPLEPEHPTRIRRTVAAVTPPPTRELVASKKSRFTD